MAIDCLIIGYNDGRFDKEVEMLRSMGNSHPNFRDINLNHITYQGKPYRAMDILDHFHYEGRNGGTSRRSFHNAEVLWMVIMYLGSYLSKHGFSFDYVNLFQFEKDELREKLLNNEYLSVAVTTTIYNYDTPIIDAVNFVREYNQKAKVIVGGPYIAKRSETMEEFDLQAVFKYIGADFYVRSREGEQALVRILRELKGDGNYAAIPNIAYRDGSNFLLTRAEKEINALHENIIDYSLFPSRDVGSYVNLRITKGCPFKCAFCSFPLQTDQYNVSQVEYIEQELNAIRDVGSVTGLFFIDDTVNVPVPTFKEMMRMMIRNNYGYKWHCFFRADFCDEELVDLMARAGCQGIFLGLESANDQILRNMHKTARKKHYLDIVPRFKNAGIQVFASLFFGFPGETYETAQETMDFLVETEPDFYRPLIWYCDPVTPIWAEKEKYGLKGYHFSWSHETMDVKTACDLVDRCFMNYDTPLWVPDPGFNFVSLFLLQNRGMTFPQIKTFLKSFNAVVREKVIDPRRVGPSDHLIENLRRASQYDRPAQPENETIEILSADKYRAAEKFWLEELDSAELPTHGQPNSPILERDDWRASDGQDVAEEALQSLQRSCGADRSSVWLAALSTALMRLDGRDHHAIVCALEGKGTFPVHLSAGLEQSFSELVRLTRDRVARAADHQLFAMRILNNVFRMTGYVKSYPLFEVAYLDGNSAPSSKDRFGHFPPETYGRLELILCTNGNNHLRLAYSAGQHDPENVEGLAQGILSILEAAAADPQIRLRDIELGDKALFAAEASVLLPQEALSFNF